MEGRARKGGVGPLTKAHHACLERITKPHFMVRRRAKAGRHAGSQTLTLGRPALDPVLLTKYHHASRNRITNHHLSRSNWQRSSFPGYPRWLPPYCRASAH